MRALNERIAASAGEVEVKASSPRIKELSWGRLEVEGFDRPFKDAMLFPGGAREWDWNETGTGHETGVQPGDVLELLDKGAAVIVLSRGMNGRLQVSAETLRMLKEKGVPVHVLETRAAVNLYNELCEREPVGGLFHSTC